MPSDSPAHRSASARGRKKIHRLWGVGAALALPGVAFGLWLVRALAPGAVELERPRPGDVVGNEGLEVVVRFPERGRLAPETLRVLLNGADVTDRVTTGQNGAYGRLHGLLDGENELRVQVFGRLPWPPGVFVERERGARVVRRRPLDVDRG